MTLPRLFLAGAVLAILAGTAYVSQKADEPTAARMTATARNLVEMLTPEQKTQALFEFDSPERTRWNFVPLQDKNREPTRKGLRLLKMTEDQKKAALALLQAGTSPEGYKRATTIMSLENILRDLEKPGGNVRDPGWYFVSIFGTPDRTGKWGWRLEGHHLSLNFTLDKGEVVSTTPCFFGANPAEVKGGDRKGLRALPEAEDHARALFDSLSADQKKAVLQPKQFEEIEQAKAVPSVGAPRGLPAAEMNDKQKQVLWTLLEGYASRLPADLAKVELERVKKEGMDKVHFGLAQEDKPGKPYTYRVQGPTVLVEFLNIQADSAGTPANHIHSSWRNLAGDFGIPAR